MARKGEMARKGALFTVTFVLLGIFIGLITISPNVKAPHVSCGDTITTNTTLDSDLLFCPGDGIIIGANGITLDCNGHSIRGTEVGSGVSLSSKSNVTVKNCNIQGFLYGIALTSSSNNNTLTNNTANRNYRGINFEDSNSNTLSSNTVNRNTFSGIYLTYSSSNTLSSNIANNNSHGIYILRSHLNTLSSNTVNNNVESGVILFFSTLTTIEKNSAQDNHYNGIVLASTSNNNTLINNTVNGSRYRGIYLTFNRFNTLTSNTVNSNNYGIQLESTYFNTLTSNTVNNNSYGIYARSASLNLIYNNFFSNTVNAQDDGNNMWNITKTPGRNIIGGPYLGGNFWHDYAGVDLDGNGLGDTNLPYNSNGNIANGGDFLPLTNYRYRKNFERNI